jgi:uncharacterized protein (DUF2141 family)
MRRRRAGRKSQRRTVGASPRLPYMGAMRPLLLLAPLALLTAAAPLPTGTLTLRISNVRNSAGEVHVNLCPHDQFLKPDCPYRGISPAHEGVTVVTVPNLPAGRYAAQVFHDENRNNKVDRLFGKIPKEGLAFSNDAFKRLAAPTWEDAQFVFTGAPQTIQLKMRYLLGASGPSAR